MSKQQTPGQRSKELANGLFGAKFKEAKARVDSNWEREGRYLLRIDNVKLDQNRKKQTGLFVEKTVIHVYDDADGEGHKVGETVDHSMWDHHESFLGNVKAFLAAVLGLPTTEVEESHVLQVIDDDQPLQGTVVECHNRTILTREKGKPFTVINYKREVPALELIEILSDEVKATYFPDDLLERMVEFEAQA
jgi:hypothetical protein